MLATPDVCSDDTMVLANDVAGTPITPSPFRSWWKVVSAVSIIKLVPDRAPLFVM